MNVEKLKSLLNGVRKLPWKRDASLNGEKLIVTSASHKVDVNGVLSGAPFVFEVNCVNPQDATGKITKHELHYSPNNFGLERIFVDGVEAQRVPGSEGLVGLSGKLKIWPPRVACNLRGRYVLPLTLADGSPVAAPSAQPYGPPQEFKCAFDLDGLGMVIQAAMLGLPSQ